jgi:hypothetical protein
MVVWSGTPLEARSVEHDPAVELVVKRPAGTSSGGRISSASSSSTANGTIFAFARLVREKQLTVDERVNAAT